MLEKELLEIYLQWKWTNRKNFGKTENLVEKRVLDPQLCLSALPNLPLLESDDAIQSEVLFETDFVPHISRDLDFVGNFREQRVPSTFLEGLYEKRLLVAVISHLSSASEEYCTISWG